MTSLQTARAYASTALACAALVAGAAPCARAGNLTSACVERFDPATDYFPDKAVVEDAAHFSVEYRRSYKVVTVKESYPGGPAERYVLVQCGTPAPKLEGPLADTEGVSVAATSL